MDYEQAKKLLESLLLDEEGEATPFMDAFIDVLRDQLDNHYAERDHGHSF